MLTILAAENGQFRIKCMSNITRTLRLSLVSTIVIASQLAIPAAVLATANSPAPVLITELQTGSATSASEEFIELVNVSSQNIDLGSWLVQYKSATGSSWSTKVSLSGVMEPGDRYLLASSAYTLLSSDFQFSAGLAAAGGHVRLAYPDPSVSGQLYTADLIGWGTAASPEGSAAPSPAAGKSLVRISDSSGKFIDTDVNSADFTVSDAPYPENSPVSAYLATVSADVNNGAGDSTGPIDGSDGGVGTSSQEVSGDSQSLTDSTSSTPPESGAEQSNPQPEANVPTTDESTNQDTGGSVDASVQSTETTAQSSTGNSPDASDPAQQPAGESDVLETAEQASVEQQPEVQAYPLVRLSELFIDPPSPQKDAADEYIEIFNPLPLSVNLSGYQLHTGATFSRHYVIGDTTIQPGEYLSFYARDTGLALSNNGGAARIVLPNGEAADSVEYKAAKVNTAWALINGEWQWTAVITPNEANQPTPPKIEPIVAATALKQTVSTAAKKSAKSSVAAKTVAKKPAKANVVTKTASTKLPKKTAAKPVSGVSASSESNEDEPVAKGSLNVPILAGVGSLAVLYAVYEYRKDIANQIWKFRRYAANRRAAGTQA